MCMVNSKQPYSPVRERVARGVGVHSSYLLRNRTQVQGLHCQQTTLLCSVLKSCENLSEVWFRARGWMSNCVTERKCKGALSTNNPTPLFCSEILIEIAFVLHSTIMNSDKPQNAGGGSDSFISLLFSFYYSDPASAYCVMYNQPFLLLLNWIKLCNCAWSITPLCFEILIDAALC